LKLKFQKINKIKSWEVARYDRKPDRRNRFSEKEFSLKNKSERAKAVPIKARF